MSTCEPLVTAEEFARIPDDNWRYELVEGRVVRMSLPGARHGALATRIAFLLCEHVDRRNLGVVVTPSGFKLATNPDTVRGPDVAFIRRERIPPAGLPESFWAGAPDLAVEIRSPGDRRSEVLKKVDEYLTRGSMLVWVVAAKQKTVTVYRRLLPPVTLSIDDTLEAGDVVPGFSCELRKIFQ
jgi:Uma2 family endonuclease